MTNAKTNTGPALQVLGVTKTHGLRAVRWMRARNLLAFYSQKDRSLNAFEFRHGREWTYDALNKALEATQ